MNKDDRADLYWLYAIPGMGLKTAERLLDTFGSAAQIRKNAKRAAALVGGEAGRQALLACAKSDHAERTYEKILARGIRFTAFPLPDYPEKLRRIPDPPFGITWMGSLPDEHLPAVAVVGARQCSEYGRCLAAHFGADLGAAGVQVISGMAVGIDGIAQRNALQAGGKSFALLGGGVDICYPQGNRDLYDSLRENGGVIAERPPGTEPLRQYFPARNRLISAFCDILLVIEARQRSGTLITVDMALEQGRDVFAVPGRVTDALSVGCNNLIRQGAGIASSAEDLLYALGMKNSANHVEKDRKTRSKKTDQRRPGAFSPGAVLTDEEAAVFSALDLQPRSLDEIAGIIAAQGRHIPLPLLMEHLVDLCVKRVVREEAGRFLLRN
ncbi:MAG: DNA-processing protein DprA [Lachnospiraceae bacterium]|nr:DNA-processing protein DprA [Lachnospiraceae bacterium]